MNLIARFGSGKPPYRQLRYGVAMISSDEQALRLQVGTAEIMSDKATGLLDHCITRCRHLP